MCTVKSRNIQKTDFFGKNLLPHTGVQNLLSCTYCVHRAHKMNVLAVCESINILYMPVFNVFHLNLMQWTWYWVTAPEVLRHIYLWYIFVQWISSSHGSKVRLYHFFLKIAVFYSNRNVIQNTELVYLKQF